MPKSTPAHLARSRAWAAAHPDRVRAYQRAYSKRRYHNDPAFRAKCVARAREYRRTHPPKPPSDKSRLRAYQRAYQKRRYHNDPAFRAKSLARSREYHRTHPLTDEARARYRARAARRTPEQIEAHRRSARESARRVYWSDPQAARAKNRARRARKRASGHEPANAASGPRGGLPNTKIPD